MQKSKGGSGGGSDGRKGNSPPEHGKIKPAEIRNRWGAKGKPPPPSSMDEELLRQANVYVSRDEHGPVTAGRRLIQEEFRDAFGNNGEPGDPKVRDRVINRLFQTSARVELEWKEFLEHVVERKAELSKQVYFAKVARAAPPDVLPHPDHVIIKDGRVYIIGPIDHAGRDYWEVLKAAIRITACKQQLWRDYCRRAAIPSSIAMDELKRYEKDRRALMRRVPKGWNWKENIYCRFSRQGEAEKIIGQLKAISHVL